MSDSNTKMSDSNTKLFIQMVKERYSQIGAIVMPPRPEGEDTPELRQQYALEIMSGHEALMHAVIGSVFAMTKSKMLPEDIGTDLYKRCEKIADDLHKGFIAQAIVTGYDEAQQSKAVH